MPKVKIELSEIFTFEIFTIQYKTYSLGRRHRMFLEFGLGFAGSFYRWKRNFFLFFSMIIFTHAVWVCFVVMYQSNRSLNILPSPRAYPGHLTYFPAREGGNLMNLVFPGAEHLITTHRGWGVWSLLDFMLQVALIPRGVVNHGGDKPSCIQSERYPIRGGLAEKQRLA